MKLCIKLSIPQWLKLSCQKLSIFISCPHRLLIDLIVKYILLTVSKQQAWCTSCAWIYFSMIAHTGVCVAQELQELQIQHTGSSKCDFALAALFVCTDLLGVWGPDPALCQTLPAFSQIKVKRQINRVGLAMVSMCLYPTSSQWVHLWWSTHRSPGGHLCRTHTASACTPSVPAPGSSHGQSRSHSGSSRWRHQTAQENLESVQFDSIQLFPYRASIVQQLAIQHVHTINLEKIVFHRSKTEAWYRNHKAVQGSGTVQWCRRLCDNHCWFLSD